MHPKSSLWSQQSLHICDLNASNLNTINCWAKFYSRLFRIISLIAIHLRSCTVNTLVMAVGAQNDLGGQQTFARKMIWCIAFLCQNWDGFFCPNWGVLQKKKVFPEIWTVFLSKKRCSPKKKRSFLKFEQFFCPNKGVLQKKKKKKKGLHRNWDGILAMVCPNIQTICPNE